MHDLIGQPIAQRLLTNIIAQSKSPSTFLFIGPAHSGRLSAALWLAKAFNCPQADPFPCLTCQSCKQIAHLQSPILSICNLNPLHEKLELVATLLKEQSQEAIQLCWQLLADLSMRLSQGLVTTASQKPKEQEKLLETITDIVSEFDQVKGRGYPEMLSFLNPHLKDITDIFSVLQTERLAIEQVRTIRDAAMHKPLWGNKKVFIVHGVDKLSTEAVSPFLKILEEPPESAIFILIALKIENVMQTIISRSFQVKFKSFTLDDLDALVKEHYGLERISEEGMQCLKRYHLEQKEVLSHSAFLEFWENDLHNEPNPFEKHRLLYDYLIPQVTDYRALSKKVYSLLPHLNLESDKEDKVNDFLLFSSRAVRENNVNGELALRVLVGMLTEK